VDATHLTGDIFSENQLKLHTLGTSWPCRWVTVHDTDADGFAEFNANSAAKTAGATPFKRPENAAFLPGSGFDTFFFDPTGDTDANSGNQPTLAARGAWGSIFRVDFPGNSDEGRISIFFLGDAEHAAFDNVTFGSTGLLLVAEDRGDTLHRQLNALDSIWALDVRNPNASPLRLVAVGRDPQSTVDVTYGEAHVAGFQNEGDNEPTGLYVSEGGTSVQDLQGKPMNPNGARAFFTQQHGMNRVFEIIAE
jgi:secreted PhoX family phosphatase